MFGCVIELRRTVVQPGKQLMNNSTLKNKPINIGVHFASFSVFNAPQPARTNPWVPTIVTTTLDTHYQLFMYKGSPRVLLGQRPPGRHCYARGRTASTVKGTKMEQANQRNRIRQPGRANSICFITEFLDGAFSEMLLRFCRFTHKNITHSIFSHDTVGRERADNDRGRHGCCLQLVGVCPLSWRHAIVERTVLQIYQPFRPLPVGGMEGVIQQISLTPHLQISTVPIGLMDQAL
ncbi:hypothetical protein J6590_041844 [Homalodisca vitripennis]|nr:hypothetical protein J6590_041844 [Homalodisca vitripennis]